MIWYGEDKERAWRAAMLLQHPHVMCAALEVAYDNGGINVDCTEEQFMDRLADWMRRPDVSRFCIGVRPILGLAEWELSCMSLGDMQTLATSERGDAEEVIRRHGVQAADKLLDRIFEEVV